MSTQEGKKPATDGKAGKKRSTQGSLIELVVIVGAAILLAFLIQLFLVKPYRIPSESMEPTLDVGQRVLVSRVAYEFGGKPERGDIVVFHPPAGADGNICGVQPPRDAPCPAPTPEQKTGDGDTFIKRVLGLPGDMLAIKDGYAIINGKKVSQGYVKPCTPGDPQCEYPRAIKIPPDHYFMMGDNRGASDDSRYWGPVPKKWIIGEAFWTYWPPDRFGPL